MKHKSPIQALFTVVLLIAASLYAHAVMVVTQLKPGALQDSWASYDIQIKDTAVKDADTSTTVVVTISPLQDRKLSPVRGAILEILDGSKSVSEIPLEEKLMDGKLQFWFRLSPNLLKDSKFTFRQNAFAQSKNNKGEPVILGIPGGAGAYFYPRDFLQVTKK